MTVYATQCPLMRVGQSLVPKFKLGLEDPAGRELRASYGPLIWVLEPNAAPWTPGVMDKLREGLSGMKEQDHLLLLGNPVLMSMMAVIAGDKYEVLNFLQWSNGGYRAVSMQL